MPVSPSDNSWPSPASRFVAAGLLGVMAVVGIAISTSRPIARQSARASGQASLPAGGGTREAVGEPATHGVDGGVGAAEIEGRDSGALRPVDPIGRLNLNTATKAELEMLPGVGPALADRIIADRESGGAFTSVDDLGRVKGFGPRMMERLRGLVKVE